LDIQLSCPTHIQVLTMCLGFMEVSVGGVVAIREIDHYEAPDVIGSDAARISMVPVPRLNPGEHICWIVGTEVPLIIKE